MKTWGSSSTFGWTATPSAAVGRRWVAAAQLRRATRRLMADWTSCQSLTSLMCCCCSSRCAASPSSVVPASRSWWPGCRSSPQSYTKTRCMHTAAELKVMHTRIMSLLPAILRHCDERATETAKYAATRRRVTCEQENNRVTSLHYMQLLQHDALSFLVFKTSLTSHFFEHAVDDKYEQVVLKGKAIKWLRASTSTCTSHVSFMYFSISRWSLWLQVLPTWATRRQAATRWWWQVLGSFAIASKTSRLPCLMCRVRLAVNLTEQRQFSSCNAQLWQANGITHHRRLSSGFDFRDILGTLSGCNWNETRPSQ